MNKNQIETITIKEYLDRRGIKYEESNGELITKCIFSNCDSDSTGNEAHLYFDAETGLYQCKKCSAQGNIFTLVKHYGDKKSDVLLKKPKSIQELSNELLVKNNVVSVHLKGNHNKKNSLYSLGIVEKICEEILHKGGFARRDIYGIIDEEKAKEYIKNITTN